MMPYMVAPVSKPNQLTPCMQQEPAGLMHDRPTVIKNKGVQPAKP